MLGPLTGWLLRSSFEGTMRCEATVRAIAHRYGHPVEAVFLADAALLTVGGRTLSYSREPTVPPLDQVSPVHALIAEIHRGGLSPRAAARRLDAIVALPVRWSRPWQVVGLVLFSVGFGVSVQATWQQVVAHSALFDAEVPGNLGPLWTWLGWLLFAVGVMLVFSMAPRDFPWALGLILLTAAVTEVGTRAAGEPVGTFLGAAVMTATALLVSRRPGRPPAYVLYLGAFYVLTPGSHGLRGLESWIGGHPVQGITGVADMVGLIVAIAVGMLVGAAAVASRR